MQPFTHPDLIRQIHEDKVREMTEPRRGGNEGWSQRVVSGVRAMTGGLLIAVGRRLAPTEAPEAPQVIDLATRRTGTGEADAASRKAA